LNGAFPGEDDEYYRGLTPAKPISFQKQ